MARVYPEPPGNYPSGRRLRCPECNSALRLYTDGTWVCPKAGDSYIRKSNGKLKKVK